MLKLYLFYQITCKRMISFNFTVVLSHIIWYEPIPRIQLGYLQELFLYSVVEGEYLFTGYTCRFADWKYIFRGKLDASGLGAPPQFLS